MKKRKAGRPKRSGKYGEATVPIRVPLSLLQTIKNMLQDFINKQMKVK